MVGAFFEKTPSHEVFESIYSKNAIIGKWESYNGK